MKNIFRILAVAALTAVISVPAVMAGNDERRGTPGATELLINPWARSTGWGSINTANARGIDAFFSNVAGLSFIEGTEFSYSNTLYGGGKNGMLGAASINAFGLAHRISEKGVLGCYVMAMSFGDIDVTSETSPDGGNGTFSPTYMNLNVAYSHSFTQSIHAGAVIKVINESTDNVGATGVGLDAGIQYVTGGDDELKFGISLKNIGPSFSFSGTGLSFSTINNAGNSMTVEFREAEMELPTCLNIGASYDFLLGSNDQRITVAGNFTSNAFLKDNFGIGVEYSLLNRVQLRGAYVYQTSLWDKDLRTTFNTGLSAGASFIVPLSKDKEDRSLTIDYSYRTCYPLRGTHTIGASIKL